MKILVTGAAGFIGFHLVRLLVKENYDVVGIDNINDYYPTSLKYSRLKECGINEDDIYYNKLCRSDSYSNYRFAKVDIEDDAAIMLLFQNERFDYVVNLAAQAGVRYSLENPKAYIKSNVMGFLNILEACRLYKPQKLIYASSSSVYGTNVKQPFSIEDRVDSPINIYAVSKKTNELMAHAYSNLYGLNTAGLRFFTVYGPWGRPDMAPFLFADAIVKGKPIQVFNHGKMQRDFTYIDDIVQGISLVLFKKNQEKYSIFNIGNSKPVDLLHFIHCLEDSFGIKAEMIMKEMQAGDLVKTWADISALKKAVGYEPKTNIEDGVSKFVSWYKDYFSF